MQQRFAAALELRELMIAMRRQVLVREHPGESDDEIDARLREWVLTPPPPPTHWPGQGRLEEKRDPEHDA